MKLSENSVININIWFNVSYFIVIELYIYVFFTQLSQNVLASFNAYFSYKSGSSIELSKKAETRIREAVVLNILRYSSILIDNPLFYACYVRYINSEAFNLFILVGGLTEIRSRISPSSGTEIP